MWWVWKKYNYKKNVTSRSQHQENIKLIDINSECNRASSDFNDIQYSITKILNKLDNLTTSGKAIEKSMSFLSDVLCFKLMSLM